MKIIFHPNRDEQGAIAIVIPGTSEWCSITTSGQFPSLDGDDVKILMQLLDVVQSQIAYNKHTNAYVAKRRSYDAGEDDE
jgi:hypothetical protein